MDYTANKTVGTAALPGFMGKKKKPGKREMLAALKKKVKK
jgi:hypothetical protein